MAETVYNSEYTGEQVDSAVAWMLAHQNELTFGGAVSGTTIAAPSVPSYWIVGAGTYTCGGSETITIDDGYLGIISFNGTTWSSDTFEVGSGVGGGMLVERTEDEYHVKYNFVDNSPALAVSTQSIVMGGNTKTATFNVSGQRLKGNITISVSGSNFSLSQTQLTPTDGEVASTPITLTYSGTATATATITISSTGATSKTISAQYTEQQVPTIDISTDTITFKAGVGGTQTKTLLVKGYNLEGAITLAFTNNVGGRFTLSQSSFSPSGGSVNAQVTITYTPQSGDTGTFSATLRATSTNATKVDVPLVGRIAGTLSITPSAATIGIASGGSGTATFNIVGTELTEGATISIDVNGDGFYIGASGTDKSASLTVGSSGSINESIVVRFAGSNNGNATLTIADSVDEITDSASVNGVISTPLPVGYHFDKDKVRYTVLSGQQTVSAKKVDTTTTAGAIEIPASVNDLGLEATDGTNTATGTGMTYSVTNIPDNAFLNCTSITSLVINANVTSLPNQAFANVGSGNGVTLSRITICASVTNINQNCFYGAKPVILDIYGNPYVGNGNCYGNNKLEKVIIRGSGVASASATSFNTPSLQNGKCRATLYVPDDLTNYYRAKEYIGTIAVATDGVSYCAFPDEGQIKGISELT